MKFMFNRYLSKDRSAIWVKRISGIEISMKESFIKDRKFQIANFQP